jgi:hypothetical protein
MAKTMLKTKQPPKLTTGKKTPAASRAPRKPSRGGGSQRFVVSHPYEADFKLGLRAYAKYRDLGISQATGGLAQAHVIRFVPPFRAEEVSQLHYHDVEFQMIYVLKGWIRSEFAEQGAHTMHAGACWIQPPRIEHKVLGYSDDCEVLEIILPAKFETVMLE